MTKPTDMLNSRKSHAQLSLILAILKAFRLIELITIVNCLLALAALIYAQNLSLKLMSLLIFALGLGVIYVALRIRIDVTLFEGWDGLDITELDAALVQLKPQFLAGRTLETRMGTSYMLFKYGLALILLQLFLLVTLVWFINN